MCSESNSQMTKWNQWKEAFKKLASCILFCCQILPGFKMNICKENTYIELIMIKKFLIEIILYGYAEIWPNNLKF